MNCPNCKKKNIQKDYICGIDPETGVIVCDDCREDRHELAKEKNK